MASRLRASALANCRARRHAAPGPRAAHNLPDLDDVDDGRAIPDVDDAGYGNDGARRAGNGDLVDERGLRRVRDVDDVHTAREVAVIQGGLGEEGERAGDVQGLGAVAGGGAQEYRRRRVAHVDDLEQAAVDHVEARAG